MLKKELETAKELAAKAGNILLERYQENPSVSWKGIDAPVTAADRAASEFLVRELKRLFPGDGILSEEEQNAPELRNLRRVIASNGAAHDRIVEITESVAPGLL